MKRAESTSKTVSPLIKNVNAVPENNSASFLFVHPVCIYLPGMKCFVTPSIAVFEERTDFTRFFDRAHSCSYKPVINRLREYSYYTSNIQ